MKRKGLYGIVAAVGMTLAANALSGVGIVHATETGTIITLSEQVFKEMDAGSDVIGNVISGSVFTLMSAEFDAAGNVWYLIQTDTGLNGYIPATNVVNMKDVEATVQQQQQQADNIDNTATPEETPDEEPAEQPDEEPAEQPDEELGELQDTELDISRAKTVRTSETVNIRKEASVESDIAGRVPREAELDCKSIVTNQENEIWYEIEYSGIKGYIKASTVEVLEVLSEADISQDVEGTPEEDLANGEITTEPATENNVEVTPQTVTAEELEPEVNNETEKTELKTDSEKKDSFVVEEVKTQEDEKKEEKDGIIIDAIVIGCFVGVIMCIFLIVCLVKKIKRLYRKR